MAVLFIDLESVRTFPLEGGRTIGRDAQNDIVILHPTVSRAHARIDIEDGQYVLTDFNSRNGTRVNGKNVLDCEPLVDGARLRIGHVRAWFYEQMPSKLPRSLAVKKDDGIVFNCACGQRLWSGQDTVGMSVVCGSCNASIEVPPRQASTASDPLGGTVAGVKLDASAGAETRPVCGICQWPIEADEKPHTCAACGTPSHAECWVENKGCSTYGCAQVNALVPKPAAPVNVISPSIDEEHISGPIIEGAIDPVMNESRVSWPHLLLGMSVLSSLLGLIAFGAPAALVGLIAFCRLLITRSGGRKILAVTVLIAAVGAGAGYVMSRMWWLGRPMF